MTPPWTTWDARAFARGAAIASLALAVVAVVTAASDEGGLAWGVRAGRTLPLAPVCAAIGAWLALTPARARGDDLALSTLGRSPLERYGAAIAGGAAVALLAALAIAASPRVDVRGFFPRAEEALAWRFTGDGFVTSDGRWSVARDGTPAFAAPIAGGTDVAAPTSALLPPAARAAAALATALAGVALPMLAARIRSRREAAAALAALGVMALATVLAFQAAAAARASALVAPLPPLLLLAWAASGYRSHTRWQRRARYPR